MSLNTILATTPLTSTNYVLKATGTTIGNSLIWDNGTNVGIGNTNTSYTLDVSGTLRTTGSAYFALTSGTLSVGMTTGTGRMFVKQTSAFLYEGLNVYALSNDSFVGIGHTGSLAVVNSSYNSTGSYCPLTFNTSDTERMRITSGGNVLIGTTTNNGNLVFPRTTNNVYISTFDNDTISIATLLTGVGRLKVENLGTGAVTATAGVLSTTSDMNLKIEDGFIDNALDKVLKLTPRYFLWKEESGLPTDLRQLGFYAQEVNEALGEEVANTPKEEDGKWGIYDRGMIAMITKAIQEQNQIIQELSNRLIKLESK
jgi:hypothetical protein